MRGVRAGVGLRGARRHLAALGVQPTVLAPHCLLDCGQAAVRRG